MRIYRFRTIESLLGNNRELAFQSIYLADPIELNDPTDGYRDVIWCGDSIVWGNLFKHYIYCLNHIYYKHVVLQSSSTPLVDTADMPVLGRWDLPLTPEQNEVFQNIYDTAVTDLDLKDAAKELGESKLRVNRRILQAYLDWLNNDLKAIMDNVYSQQAHIARDPAVLSINHGNVTYPNHNFVTLPELIDMLKADSVSEDADDGDLLDAIISRSLRAKYRLQTEQPEGINRVVAKIMFDFTPDYLDNLLTLTSPVWYTACFTTDHTNSTMWSTYADDHKGVCLIFELEGSEDLQSQFHLTLRPTMDAQQRTADLNTQYPSRKPYKLDLYSINYIDTPSELDFFTNIIVHTPEVQKRLWYSYENEHFSECSSHIHGNTFDQQWLEKHKADFLFSILSKNSVWSHESEYRLVATPIKDEYLANESRVLHYDFESLKGIIFGIRTSDDDKINIMKIIKQKCNENDRQEFALHQAHYSQGTIATRPIGFDWQ